MDPEPRVSPRAASSIDPSRDQSCIDFLNERDLSAEASRQEVKGGSKLKLTANISDDTYKSHFIFRREISHTAVMTALAILGKFETQLRKRSEDCQLDSASAD
jgi:hypothetical protein